jgi:hypothetical protein
MSDSHAAGNLCQSEQNSMLRASLIATVVGLAAAIALSRYDAATWYRAAAFVPFYLAATWLLQALGKT